MTKKSLLALNSYICCIKGDGRAHRTEICIQFVTQLWLCRLNTTGCVELGLFFLQRGKTTLTQPLSLKAPMRLSYLFSFHLLDLALQHTQRALWMCLGCCSVSVFCINERDRCAVFPSRRGQMLLLFFSLLLLFLRGSAHDATRTHTLLCSAFFFPSGRWHFSVRLLTWLQDAVCLCVLGVLSAVVPSAL